MASQTKNFKMLFRYQTVLRYVFFLLSQRKSEKQIRFNEAHDNLMNNNASCISIVWAWPVLSMDSKCSAELYPEPVLSAWEEFPSLY